MAYKRKEKKKDSELAKDKPKVEPEILVSINITGKESIEVVTSKGVHKFKVEHSGSDRKIVKA